MRATDCSKEQPNGGGCFLNPDIGKDTFLFKKAKADLRLSQCLLREVMCSVHDLGSFPAVLRRNHSTDCPDRQHFQGQ